MIEGIIVKDLIKRVDDRGFFTELVRLDWSNLFEEETIVQVNHSYSYPNVIRAWHRHLRGQVDYFTCVDGAVKICAFDDREGSSTFMEVDEIVISNERLRVVRIPGFLWHGFKAVGDRPAKLLYCVNRLYNYEEPDEERRAWNDPTIIPSMINGNKDDPRVGKPWDWNSPPHR